MDTTTTNIVSQLRVERGSYDRHARVEIKFYDLRADGKLYNPYDEWDNLTIRAYEYHDIDSERSEPGRLIGWEVAYGQPFCVNLSTAETYVKLLRAVQRKLDKYAAEFGVPEGFGQFALRVCKALGVTQFIGAERNHWSEAYETRPVQDIGHAIGHELAKLYEGAAVKQY